MNVKFIAAGIFIGASMFGPTGVLGQEQIEPGRFQGIPVELPDGAPALWVLDTAFGRVALCNHQNVPEGGGVTSGGVSWSVSEITCSAFGVPERGPWDRYQEE